MARSPIASDEFLKRLDELEKQRDERNRHESIRGTEREAKNNPVASDSFLKRLDELTEQRRAQREQEEKQKKLEDVKQRLQFLPEQLRANRTNARRAPIEEETAARMRAQRNAAAETNPVAEALARANEAYRAGDTVQRTPGTETAARRAARTAGLTPDAGTLLSQMTARITGTELSPTGYTADPQRVLSSMTATEAERQRRAREEAAETEAEIAARRAVEVFASRKAQERREAENARIREEQARQEKPMTAKEALEATRQEETLGLSAPGYRAAETPELDRETVEAFNKASNPGGTLGRALDVLIGDPFEAMSAGAGRAFEAMAADNPNAALLALGGLAEDINRAQNGRGGAGARSSEAEAELFHSAVIEPLQKQAEEEKEAFDAQYAQRLEHAGRDGGKTYGTFMQAFGELGRMLTSSGMAQAALGQPLATLAGAGMGRYSEMAGTALKNLSNFAISAGAAGQSYLEATAAGANAPESAAYAILSGALEYGTNKLFGGNPIEDADAGAVNRLIGKFAHDERLLRLLGSMPVELVGEGMEEVISEALGPVLQRLTYDPHASMATLDQLLEAGIQGVLVAGLAEGGDALASIPGRLRADRESGAPVATEEQEPLQNGSARDMLQPEAAATAQASAANDRQINSPLQSESVQEEIERVPGTYEGTDAGAPVEYERAGATPANETATATETERGGEDNVREENRAEWAREETQSTGDDDLRRGRGERVDSPHSGIEAERLEGRTGGGEERREPGARRGNRARDVALSYAPLRSTREYLGLADGSETTALREAPESYVEQDEELRRISQAVRQRGYTPHLFTGRPELGDGRAVNGLVRDGDVFLRIDSAKWSATQIWDHERFHLMQMEDPGLVERVKRAVLDKYGEQELRAKLETYLKAYAGSYGINLQGIADWDDAGVDTVLEELLADAYAGMDTQGVGVGEYRQTVIDSAEARQAAAYTDYAGAEAQRDAENPDSEGAVMADGPASEWAGGPVDPSFAETLERTNGGGMQALRLGRTGEALESIGVDSRDIMMRGGRAQRIMQNHPGMTLDVVKQLPEILANPLLVLKVKRTNAASRNTASRLVVFGDVNDNNNRPVLVELELQPMKDGNAVRDYNLAVNAYGLNGEPKSFIEGSEVLYVNPDRDKTGAWLRGLGLQLSAELGENGSIGSVTYQDGKATAKGVSGRKLFSSVEEGTARYSLGLSRENIEAVQNIGYKSLNDFNDEDIRKTEAFARQYFREMGVKSPFFRAWFGDWRANDQTPVQVASEYNKFTTLPSTVKNDDTSWNIQVSRKGIKETNAHTDTMNLNAVPLLPYIEDIVKKAVLLDTYGIRVGKRKSAESLLMHSLYAVADMGNGPELVKLYVEEINAGGNQPTIKRFYQLQNIECWRPTVNGLSQSRPRIKLTANVATIADLFADVNSRDKNFSPQPASKVVDEDGRPLVVYHGTDADFTVFDRSKGRSTMDIQGLFFSPWEQDAGDYGENVGAYYLNIKNPAPESVAYEALNRFAGQNNAGIKAREYLESLGYDGVDNSGEEYIAFEPTQVKSATDNSGTFNKNDPDVRYSMNRANGTAEDTTERPETFEQYVSENAKRLIRDEVTMRELREEWDRGALRFPERESPAVQRMRDEAIQRLTGEAAREQTESTHELAETIRDEVRERERERQIVRSMHVPKAEFEGTPALQKLGVRIEDRLGLFSRAEGLRQNDAAAKSVRRETEKAERRLAKEARATKGVSGTEIERIIEAERNFAQGIANGVYDQADIPRTLNEDRVLELADYYIAERAVNSDLIGRQRREITMDLDGAVEEIMSSVRVGETEIKKSGAWTINHRTPERNMRRIFGDETGEAVNDFIFRPVQINESERLRFVNRMYDEVRTFEDSTGKVSELSKHERAVVQWLMEGKGAERQLRELGQQRQEEILDCARHAQRAESLREMNQDIYDDIRNLHLTMQEADLVRRLALRDLANKEMEEGSVDRAKMDNARSKYEEMYDTFYNAINDFLVVHGYEPIGFVSGYAPHFQSDETYSALERAIKQMGGQVSALPNAIAGLTKGFRPNKRWDPYLLKRRGIETDYDVAAGYERYVDYMSDILYHTDDIMRTRALARSLRSIGSDEETRERLEWISHLRETDDKATVLAALEAAGYIQQGDVVSDERMEALLSEYVDKVHDELKDRKTKYGDVVTWLDDYANSLASKQVMADRDMERSMGRVTLNVGQRLVDWFARAQVAGNVSSAFNQAAQLPQIGAEVGTVNLARAVGSLAAENIRMVRQDIGERNFGAAIADLFSGAMRKGAWAQESDFLTEKQGVNFIVNTPSQMIMSAAFKPLEFMDSLVSTLAVRGKYLQEIHKGQTHEQAMKTADSFGRNVMGSRAKGTVPLAFKSKNLINKMLNMFQIEAFNSWEHLSQDVLGKDFREIERTRGRRAAAASAAGVFVKMLLAAFVLNRLDEELYGGTPAPFDLFGLGANFIASGEGLTTNDLLRTTFDNVWEQLTGDRLFDTDAKATDSEFNWDNALEDTWYNLSNEIPFLRNASALLGWGDDTLPLPDLSGVTDAVKSNGPFSSEVARQLLGVAADMMPFGRQLEKTAQGLEAVLRGGRFKGYGDNARLQYPVSDDFGTLVRAMLFGLSALPEGDAFYASGQSALSAKQTQIYSELVDDGADRDVVYRTMQAWREAGNDDTLDNEEKNLARRNIIRDADLTDEQKLMLFSGLNGSSSQSETFQTLMDTGLSWEQIMDAYETYTEIKGSDGLSAYERATEFSNWVEEQEFEPEQEESIRELLKISASKTQYDKLKDAGLSAEEASSLSEQLGQLVPESGKASVSDLQKLRVVVDSGLSRKKKQQAVRSMLSDSAAERFDYLIEAGITPETYVDFREAVDGLQSDTDGEGKTIPGSKKEKVLRAIDALDLTNKQKTALYYASGYSESGLEDVNWSTRGLSLPSLDAWREDSAEPEGLRLPSVG